MENKKSYSAEIGLPIEKVAFGRGYIYPTVKVYGCARIVPPEEREKLKENKQTNI